MNEFTVCSIPNEPHDDERIYAFFYAGDYKTITGRAMKKGNIKRFICIISNFQKVYKQYSALNGIHKGYIAIDYESKCNLGVRDGEKIKVYSISKFCYVWHKSDIISKLSFLIAIISLALTIYALIK